MCLTRTTKKSTSAFTFDTRKDLERHFYNTDLEIDYQWEYRKNQAAFIITRKPSTEIQS